jgi:NTE family protein
VLRALEERGIYPNVYAGSSIGAVVAAGRACGTSLADITERALRLKKRDLFRVNHVGLVLERTRMPALYCEEPFRAFVTSLVPRVRFDELGTPVYVNTVDVEHGTQVVWGLPGFRDVFVDDAVYASCALPIFFPPGKVDGRYCIDGGTLDNLPVSLVANESDVIIAVDVGNTDVGRDADVATRGLASISMRAATIMMHALQANQLEHWKGPPLLLVRPKVTQFGWFNFDAGQELVEAGYEAAVEALAHLDRCAASKSGIFPRTVVQLAVDQSRCTGCGLCAAAAPSTMLMTRDGTAAPRSDVVEWSPADGEFIRHCPTGALSATRLETALEKVS